MSGVEHLDYWSVTEDFADSKWCYAFNNFLWILRILIILQEF